MDPLGTWREELRRRVLFGGLQGGPCTSTNASASAVMACTNEVRVNPDVLASAPCFSRIRSWLLEPRRRPLEWSDLLARVAQSYTKSMASAGQMLPADNGLLAPLAETSESLWPTLAVNVAAGYKSAKEVVTAWLCSEEHRNNMFSAAANVVGVATMTSSASGVTFYAQMFQTQWYEIRPTVNNSYAASTCMTTRAVNTSNSQMVEQAPCAKAVTQKLRFVLGAVEGGTKYFKIMDWVGRCLMIHNGDVSDYAALETGPCAGTPDQLFRLEQAGSSSDLSSSDGSAGQQQQQQQNATTAVATDFYAFHPKHTDRCIQPGDGGVMGGKIFFQVSCSVVHHQLYQQPPYFMRVVPF